MQQKFSTINALTISHKFGVAILLLKHCNMNSKFFLLLITSFVGLNVFSQTYIAKVSEVDVLTKKIIPQQTVVFTNTTI